MASIKMGIERNGRKIIPCMFDKIKPAIVDGKESNEIFITQNNGLFGFARVPTSTDDHSSRYTDTEYTNISPFENGVAVVSRHCVSSGMQYGIINMYGAETLKCKYDDIQKLTDKFFLVRRNDKYGIYCVGCFDLFIPVAFTHIEYEAEKFTLHI